MKLDKEFKIRCSAIGQIMAGSIGLTEIQKAELDRLLAKDKLTEKQKQTVAEYKHKLENPLLYLPKTLTNYVHDWIKEQLYDRKKDFKNKYTSKGLIVEDGSIDLLSEYDNAFPPYVKNNEHFEDEYFEGTPDIIKQDSIPDVKSSWDCFTFPLFDTEIDNKDYIYQLNGYMRLTKKKKAELCYVLSNTPDNIIHKEAWILVNDSGYDLETAIEIVTKKHTYDNIPIELRVKKFYLEYDENLINMAIERVKLIREYIKTIEL